MTRRSRHTSLPRPGGSGLGYDCPFVKSPRHGGFTLVELLVVVSVVAVLISIMLPSFGRARLLAKRAACMANFSCIGKAALAYQVEFRSYIPICYKNFFEPPSSRLNPWKSWRTGLLPYTPGYNVFNCPAATDQGERAERFHSAEEVAGDQNFGTINAGSYGIIYQTALASFKTVNRSGNEAVGHPSQSFAFSTEPGVAWADPARSIYAADAVFTDGPLQYPSKPGHRGYGTSTIMPPSKLEYRSGDITRRFADRHLGTVCLFVDGHVAVYETQVLDEMTAGSPDCIWDVE